MRAGFIRLGAKVLLTNRKHNNSKYRQYPLQTGTIIGIERYRGRIYRVKLQLEDGTELTTLSEMVKFSGEAKIMPSERREIWIRSDVFNARNRCTEGYPAFLWKRPEGYRASRYSRYDIHVSHLAELLAYSRTLRELRRQAGEAEDKLHLFLRGLKENGTLPAAGATARRDLGIVGDLAMPFAEEISFKLDQLWEDSPIAGIISRIRGAGEYDDSVAKAALLDIFAAVESRLEDGFQLMDIVPILGAALKDICLVAEELTGSTGAEKREFVAAAVASLYNLIDKGVDGTKNRIDIPWVPQVAEDFIERKMLPIVISVGIEAAISMLNKDRK